MRKFLILTTFLCLLLVLALPLMAQAESLLDPAPVPSTTTTTSTSSSGSGRSEAAPVPAATTDSAPKAGGGGGIPYRTVTPEEFSGKVNTLTDEVKQSLDKIVVPTAEVVVIILLLALVVGSLFGIKVVRKYALAGLGFSALALILYYSIPSIMGFINHVAKVLNS